MKEPLPRNTPLFFRKLPLTEETPPNATYSRFLNEWPSGRAHEIVYHGEKWIVDDKDILTVHEALVKTAEQMKADIDVASRWPTVAEKAKYLGISETTLRKRLKLIQNHLPNDRTDRPEAAK